MRHRQTSKPALPVTRRQPPRFIGASTENRSPTSPCVPGALPSSKPALSSSKLALPVISGRAPADTNGVNESQTSLATDAAGLSVSRESWSVRFASWVAAARAHRVICLVLGIWLLNGFDLAFTLLSHRHGLLQEQNPIARLILGTNRVGWLDGTSSIVLFKIALVLIGSYPLLRFRRLRLAELAAYLVLAVYVFLAVRWSTCFDLYAAALPGDIGLAGLEDMEITAPH